VLAHDASGVADRFLGRRLALRLRWQRRFGPVDPALVAELQALHARVASPFNRCLMALELTRQQAPAPALQALQTWFDSPPARQRPGLQLHIAALAAQAGAALGSRPGVLHWLTQAQALRAHCAPFDMHPLELQALLDAAGAWAGTEVLSVPQLPRPTLEPPASVGLASTCIAPSPTRGRGLG
jgi:hypothetical protein